MNLVRMNEDRMEAKIRFGSLGYFMREGSRRGNQNALYVGPQRPSEPIQHHLTVVSNIETEEIDNIHLTSINGKEKTKKWQIVPNEIEPNIASWIKNNSTALEESSLREIERDYYCVSGWRILTGFLVIGGLLNALGSILMRPFIAMGTVRFRKESQNGRRIKVHALPNVPRMFELARKLRPLKPFIQTILPIIILRGGPRFTRLFFVTPRRMSKGDISLLIPKTADSPALVLVRWEKPRQIELARVIEQASEIYRRSELKAIIPDLSLLSSQVQMPFLFDIRGKAIP